MFIIKTMVNSGNQLVSASHGLLQDSDVCVYIYTCINIYINQLCMSNDSVLYKFAFVSIEK